MSGSLQGEKLTVSTGKRVLFEKLDITIRAGESWGILGVNGSGKTSLLHTLAGVIPPQQGKIYLDRTPLENYRGKDIARKLGLLMQDYQNPFPVTTLELVLQGFYPYRTIWQSETPSEVETALSILHQLELKEKASRELATLSGGEKRRAEIARLLVQNPTYYLLDEPVNHLDLRHQIRLLVQLEQQRVQGHALVMVLHDPNLAVRFCSHVLLIGENGKIRQGTAKNLLKREILEETYQLPLEEIPTKQHSLFTPK